MDYTYSRFEKTEGNYLVKTSPAPADLSIMTEKNLNQYTYNVILDNRIQKGEELLQVKCRLGKIFKIAPERLDKLFSNSKSLIKQGLTEQTARKYKAAIEKTGAICHIIPQKIQPMNKPLASDEDTIIQKIGKNGWLAWVIGFVVASGLFLSPFLRAVLGYLNVLVHEIGHSLFAWLFGFPSIPTFDFLHGGGFALQFGRQPIILIIYYALFAWLVYRYRKNWLSLIMLGLLVALYSWCAFRPFHHIIILYMGHGTEPLFAGILLFRAISWRKVSMSSFERPLNAVLGFFVLFSSIYFAYEKLSNAQQLSLYAAPQKGGKVWNDFVLIANSTLNIDLSTFFYFYLFVCLSVPVFVFLLYRYQPFILSIIKKLISKERSR